jgi:hypothetical protein
VAETYYSVRSARDPAWHRQQLLEAAERERRRRELDPEGVRESRRLATRRCRAKQQSEGLTFFELWQRVGGDREILARILSQEVRRGRIDYLSSSRRYHLNGVDHELRAALLWL